MSGHTCLLESTDSGTTLGRDNSVVMGCQQSTNSSYEVPAVSQESSIVKVNLHGILECHLVRDTTRSVEEIIKKLLSIYYPTVGPAAIHLFGLALLDTKKNDRFIWKSPRCLVKELQEQIKNDANLKLFVRIRFVPARDRLFKLKIFGSDVIKYLYHQLREDLLTERLRHVYGSRTKLSSAKCRGLAVLNLLIDSRLQKKSVDFVLEQHKLKDFLPPSECVAFLKKIKLEKNMKDHVKRFDISHPESSTDIEELMTGYVRDILKEILDYSVEQYDANVLDMKTRKQFPGKILVDIHHSPSGVFIDGVPFSEIKELCSASVTPNYLNNANTWNVHLDRTNGRPEVLEFESSELAESFVSCLDGYYRLIHDFYLSLCCKMEPLSILSLRKIKSHGPIETSCAIAKLDSRMGDSESYYLCKQDINNSDQFVLVYPSNGQILTELVQQQNGVFCLVRDKEKSCQDPGQLVPYLLKTEHNDILSNNIMRLKPNVEACGVLKRLFIEENEIIPEEDKQQKDQSVLSRQPVIIPESHLKISKLVGISKFTQVYEGTYKDNQTVAIKFLRTKTSPNQLYSCLEPFLYALRQHMKFREVQEPGYFAGILGVCMSMPIKIVMDYAREGSLSHFFSCRRTDQPIYLRHLVYAATQVAQGLFHLEEIGLHHGNINCQNILVFRYDMSEIVVKIGDPGMIQVYEDPSMVNNEKVNKRRLPWIAPELFNRKQNRANMKSDIFAFGTTIWEMFALGENPVDKPPSSSMSFERQKDFYQSEASKELPVTEGLRVLGTDFPHISKCKSAMLDMIERCRVFSSEDRPTAKELVRDLNTLTSSYGNQYHDYDKILDDYPIWSEAESSQMSHHADNDEDVPDILTSFPIPELDEVASSTPGQQFESLNERSVIPLPDLPQPSVASPEAGHQHGPLPNRASHQHGPLPNRAGRQLGPPPKRPLPQPECQSMIRSHQLQIYPESIGEGHYGKVKKGTLTWFGEKIVIAAKCLKSKEYTSVLQSPEFRREAEMMKELQHPNIVRFYGISNDSRGNKNVSLQGMRYMSDKRIIHSDLAGRNILMTEDLHAKISDFGLARNLRSDKDYYRRSKEKELPASWCSPEGLTTLKFTTLGDVWSYGVVLWEAFTHGKQPQYGEDLTTLGQRLNDGERLERPNCGERCSDRVWDLMKWCWKHTPAERPSFKEIVDECSEILYDLRPQVKASVTKPDTGFPEETGILKSSFSPPTPVNGTTPVVTIPAVTTDPVVNEIQTSLSSKNTEENKTTAICASAVKLITSPKSASDTPRKPRDDLNFLISKKDLVFNKEEMLGRGEFGFVYKGSYKQKEVAIKVIEESHLNYNEEQFWEEIDVFGRACHPNIVTFHGFVRDAYMLVMEFVPMGSLSNYLTLCSSGRKTISLRQSLGIMYDIASGMKYLVEQSIIHCDLAARNILLMNNMMAKISDFGLSKALEKDYYRRSNNKRMPCWWCAPEVLYYQRLTHKSDVWSYGIVAWEIFTLGETPNICEVGGSNIKDLIDIGLEHMRKGFRLKKEKTKNCPDDVFELMMKCWEWNDKDRPDFSSIHKQCLSLLDKYGKTIQQ
ncbi:uncharacterized protein LOC132549219 [Ylistrum balloti]|uniref:uncharacterized protein LOC132549219 n=1 Tax=Ylistrum balloti TaxID=509963 RepID=UPI002905A5E5|nr:uncharacterized protein LOC132549219 [Ylistrum balloti]